MGKLYKKYTLEFKEQIVREIQSNIYSLSEQARRHGLSPAIISYWIKRSEKGNLKASPDRRVKELEKEVASLKSTIGDLYRQVEVFKKNEQDIRQRRKDNSLLITGRNMVQLKKPVKR